MFVDEVDIHVTAGDGGHGCLSFRREKSAPRGGPDGGDGGDGGSVYLVASPHLNTLVNYRFHPTYTAQRGAHGSGSTRTGRNGRDLQLEVRWVRSRSSTVTTRSRSSRTSSSRGSA